MSMKRKRGRPRRTEQQDVANVDVALIEEFKKRPAFYDRSHNHYKDREHTDQQWLIISNMLGHSVPALKERLAQLRSRYHLEKKRMESLQERYRDSEVSPPQWALFKNFNFLDDHIISRSVPMRNDITRNAGHMNNKTVPVSSISGALRSSTKLASSANTVIPSMQKIPPTPKTPNCQNSIDVSDMNNDKYRAFGDFLANSLIEMDELNALNLVKKFTNEIIEMKLTEDISVQSVEQNHQSVIE